LSLQHLESLYLTQHCNLCILTVSWSNERLGAFNCLMCVVKVSD
jgi:hypothetical protein